MNFAKLTAATAIAAIASFAAVPAFAEDITMVVDTFESTQSRADVQAQVRRARAAGEVFVHEVDPSTTKPAAAGSTLTREEVRAQLRQGQRMSIVTYNPAA